MKTKPDLWIERSESFEKEVTELIGKENLKM